MTNKITTLVIDLLDKDNGMLVGEPKVRIRSTELCKKLKTMAEEPEITPINVSATILDFLHGGDDTMLLADSSPASISSVTKQWKTNRAPNERQTYRE